MNNLTMENEILSMAVEDYYGLWEVAWRMSTLFPDRQASDLLELAQTEINRLLNEEKISLFQRRKHGEQEMPVTFSNSEIEAIISDEANWSEPNMDSIQYLVGATKLGEEMYYSCE